MTAALIKQFEEVLKDVNGLSQEKIQELIQNTLAVFQDLQKRITSTSPEEKERAFADALELKHVLEGYAATLAQSVGMDQSQLARFSENPSNFSKEEWESMGDARQKLSAFQEEVREVLGAPKAVPLTTGKKKKHTSRNDWISG